MLTVENEYFIRLLLLIVKAGTSVLRLVFTKKLTDSGLQLSVFLNENKDQIDKLKEGKVLTLIQYNVLFPSNGQTTDSGNYDITLLSCLLVNIFTTTRRERNAIEKIKLLRNVFQAHHTNGSIDRDTFFKKCNELCTSINTLGHGLTREQNCKLQEVIRSVKEDNIDTKCAMQIINDANDKIDQLFENVSQKIEQLSPLLQQIKDRDMEIKELKQENRIIIGEVSITSKNPKAALGAAKILMDEAEKWKKSNAESRDTEATVNAFLQGITDAGGEIVDITEGSVLLHIRCYSVLVVSHVVNYFKSSETELRLNDIEKYLTEQVGADVNLSAIIQTESLQKVQRYLEQEESQEYTTQVRFAIKCHNSDGVLNVVKLMESGETTSKMSAISNDLSKKVGCPVTLRSSVDKHPLQQFNKGDKEDKAEIEKGDDRSDVAPTKTKAFQPMMHTEKGKEWLEKRHKRFIEERGDEPIVLRKEIETEMEKNQRLKELDKRRWELEADVERFGVGKQLQNTVGKLKAISPQLTKGSDICHEFQHVLSEAKNVYYTFCNAMANEGNAVLRNKKALVETSISPEVNVYNLKESLTALQGALQQTIHITLALKEHVCEIIEKCEAGTCESQENARTLEKRACDREKDARALNRESKKHLYGGLTASAIGMGAGLTAALFFPAILPGVVVFGVVSGVVSGVIRQMRQHENTVVELQKASKRKEEASHQQDKQDRQTQVQNDNLIDVRNKLREVGEQLLNAVSVIENLTHNVQNFHTILDDAEKHGISFTVIQTSFVNTPAKLEGKALDLMWKLKPKWLCVEEELVKH